LFCQSLSSVDFSDPYSAKVFKAGVLRVKS
jgi:hypothetical protein